MNPNQPPHDGKANSGPVDYYHLLKRRRVSFARWAEHEGIWSQEVFNAWKVNLEAQGEFYVSQEFQDLAKSLPLTQVVQEEAAVKKSEPTQTEVLPLPEEDGSVSEVKVKKRIKGT